MGLVGREGVIELENLTLAAAIFDEVQRCRRVLEVCEELLAGKPFGALVGRAAGG